VTFHNDNGASAAPAFLTPDIQQAVRFLGALTRVRAGADATAGRLAILEHHAERGYASPLHMHRADDETFFVLEGELRVEIDGRAQAVGTGAVAFLPCKLPHALVVTSPQAHYLSFHTPAGFDRFTVAVASADLDTPPDPSALAEMAASYGIEILGPPPTP
jgi:mannose-6-phosphate isomerase-like protein (cupin superfamily)